MVSSRTFEWQRCGAIPPAEPCQRVQHTADGMLAVQRGGVIEIIDDSGPPRPLAIAPHGFAFSPDGTRLALGLAGSVELRRISDGELDAALITGDGEPCPVSRVVFSAAGTHVLTHDDTGLCAFGIEDTSAFLRLSAPVEDATFDGSAVVTLERATRSSPLRISTYPLSGAAPTVWENADAVAFTPSVLSPDGASVMLVVSEAARLVPRLHRARDGVRSWSGEAWDDALPPAAFSGDSSWVAVGGAVYSVADGRRVSDRAKWAPSHSATLSNDGERLAACFRDTPGWLDATTPLPRVIGGHSPVMPISPWPMRSLALTPDGKRLVSVGQEALLWELGETFESSIPRYLGSAPYRSRAYVSPDAGTVALTGDNGGLVSTEGAEVPAGEAPAATSVDELCIWHQTRFSPDGRWMVGHMYTPTLQVAERSGTRPTTWTPFAPLAAPTCKTRFTFTPDGAGLVTSELALYRVGDWAELQPPRLGLNDDGPSADVVVSPDGSQVVLSEDCEQAQDDLGEHQQCRTSLVPLAAGSPSRLSAISAPYPSFSAEGHWLVAGSTLLHLPSGDVRSLDPRTRVALFTPDGDVIAGESDGALVRYCRVHPSP